MRTLLLIFLPFICFGQITPYGGKTNQTYIGGTFKFSDPKDQGFGTWSSTQTGIATIGSKTGIVTGVARGNDTLFYIRSGVRDSLAIYVSTSDSSGYYFESTITNLGQLQQRDCDGVTKLNLWEGGFYKSGIGQSSSTKTIYNYKTDIYQIIFLANPVGIGTNGILSIPYSKIKDFGGAIPYTVGRDSVLSQIQTFGF